MCLGYLLQPACFVQLYITKCGVVVQCKNFQAASMSLLSSDSSWERYESIVSSEYCGLKTGTMFRASVCAIDNCDDLIWMAPVDVAAGAELLGLWTVVVIECIRHRQRFF